MCHFKTNQNQTILNPNKQERKKKGIVKDPLGCLEGLLKHWEAKDESIACLHLKNKTSVIFIGNKYWVFSCKQNWGINFTYACSTHPEKYFQ